MLFSFALALLCGLFLSELCKKIHLPPLIGMIVAGILIGPNSLNLLDEDFLFLSPVLREVALIIILTRAGLTLNLDDLKKVGRPAILMSFIPALLEISAMIIFAPLFFEITIIDAALLGSVVAAVSPAVIVPKMITIIEEGRGVKKSIPQMILASASVDDVFVIILFTSFLSLAQGHSVSALRFATIPLSIITGILLGIVLGYVFSLFFKKTHLRDSQKVLIVLSLGCMLVALEDIVSSKFPFSALIAIMAFGILLKAKYPVLSARLSVKFSKLWVFAEIMLFVLVGASVTIDYALQAGPLAIVLIFSALAFRMLGVWICLLRTNLVKKERLFCLFAYIPKATVQAAIGGIPLAMGLSSGSLVLTVAVLSILITAPLGAILIDFTYKRFLS